MARNCNASIKVRMKPLAAWRKERDWQGEIQVTGRGLSGKYHKFGRKIGLQGRKTYKL